MATRSNNSFTSLLKRASKKLLAGTGYQLSKVKADQPEIISNVFNRTHHKTALLSYIRQVFEEDAMRNDRRHTNRYKTYLIAEALDELGYNVDVISYSDSLISDFRNYDLIFGLGKTLDNALEMRADAAKTKVITFATGCNPFFSNVATVNRVDDFYRRTGKMMMASARYILIDWPLQHEVADWIILHGLTFARKTYRSERISSIHAPVFMYHSVQRSDAEWVSAKKNYIWFGSGGLIHKGLDLVIDAFTDMSEYTLHICGNIENEPAFFEHYKPIIDAHANIVYHGFVDVQSEGFAQILRDCAYMVFPSASEGNSASVVTCMANGGLIPIVSPNADVDLNDYGFYTDDLSADAVKRAVHLSQQLTLDEMKDQSARIMQETQERNSFESFKNEIKRQFAEALKQIP